MMNAIEEKFHIGRNLTFTFIDSYAKHPVNLEDEVQQVNTWFLTTSLATFFLTKFFTQKWTNSK